MTTVEAFAIVLKDNEVSEKGYSNLVASSSNVGNCFGINRFHAYQPNEATLGLQRHGIQWNWPWKEEQYDFATGIKKVPYKTSDKRARISCFLSHYTLWLRCLETNTPHLILEHDSLFVRRLDFDQFDLTGPVIIGINDPIGATRKSAKYHQLIQQNHNELQRVPQIDDDQIAQGLAGNNAYIITPQAARHVVDDVRRYGAWPNDALMCYQLNPYLRVTRTYYTQVQRLKSTTT